MAFGTTRYSRRIVVQAAHETTAGTPITSTSSFSSIMTLTGAELQLESDQVNRDIYYSTFSPVAPRMAMKRFRFRIPCELRGAGVATPPEFSPLLVAAGFERQIGIAVPTAATTGTFTFGESLASSTASTVAIGVFVGLAPVRIGDTSNTNMVYLRPTTAGTTIATATTVATSGVTLRGITSSNTVVISAPSVVANIYKPITAPASQYIGNPATIWWNKDGVKHIGYYCRGNMSMNLTANQIASIEFDMSGLYATPTDVTFAVAQANQVAYATQVPELVQDLALSFDAEPKADVIADAFTLDMGNTMLNRPNYNSATGMQGIEITGRAPTASFNPDADLLANFNPFTFWENQTAAGLNWQLGGTSGNRVAMFAPATTVTNLTYVDKNGIVGYNIPLSLTGTSGDDELFLMFY
jgi:hypothetical protein